MKLIHGDCLEQLKLLPDASVDSMITDPPAGIAFMNKSWDRDKGGRDAWIAWMAKVMSQALRVIKPGGHCLVWALPRTSHWTATAIENAGWEVRDRLAHIFGSGFPKNHDVSKAIDREAGAKREVVGLGDSRGQYDGINRLSKGSAGIFENTYGKTTITAPATPAAEQWSGWGTALKPAVEDWWLCRKPLEGTIAKNVLKWGVGAINIDESRIGSESTIRPTGKSAFCPKSGNLKSQTGGSTQGRWPAHLILSHAPECNGECVDGCPVKMMGDQSGKCGGSGGEFKNKSLFFASNEKPKSHNDKGTAARYFLNLQPDPFCYAAKPSPKEREAGLDVEKVKVNDGRESPIDTPYQRGETPRKNTHPTVKSIKLMSWLVKLITPPGGVVLDPFMGSGSTGLACLKCGFDFIGIEREDEYIKIARARLAHLEKTEQAAAEKKALQPVQLSLF